MKYYEKPNHAAYCINCDISIEHKVLAYSSDKYGVSLCRGCQDSHREQMENSTIETIQLFFELKLRGVPAELEKYDGTKTVDIVVEEAKVHIEVDGVQHNRNPKQALSDLKRTFYAFKQGYFTLRIPNSLINTALWETADYITEILSLSNKKNTRRRA